MEMHQLRYVVAVARAGTFSRAARHCNVSQPSLSQQIQKLEDELGERLFDRLKREARPTPFGSLFLLRARRILEEVDAAQREAGDAREMLSGSVTIGALPTIAPYLLPEVVADFMAQFPGVSVEIQEDTTARLVRQATAWELDFAITSMPIQGERLTVEELCSEELLLALPPDHPLSRKRSVSAADLEGERLIVMKEGHCLGDQMLGFCGQNDRRQRISFRSPQLETVQAMVRAGLGISLVPQMAARQGQPDQPVYRSLSRPAPRRSIAVVSPAQRPLSRAAVRMLALVKSRLTRTAPRNV